MKATTLFWSTVLFFSACTRPIPDEAETQRQPNIVFIMVDDLGYGHLGCYGQERIQTPSLDQMAAEGTQFTQYYAGHCVCAPSRSVLMTGQHTGHTSVRINGGGSALLPGDITVAETLREAGYATGIFGKWGLGDAGTDGIPTKQGFDEFFGYLHQVHAHFFYPFFLWQNEEKHMLPENEGEQHASYSHDLIVDRALQFVRGHRNKGDKDQPFFLYLPITIPHFELLVPEDSLAEYQGKFPEPYPYVAEHYASQPTPRAVLAAMISRMDRDVGRLFALLQELGIDDDTVVFFTSDNGGYLLDRENFFVANGPLRGGKGLLYEGGIRVPMIVRWPGRVVAGATDDLIWAAWDVMPTLAELAGAGAPGNIDGISVASRLLGEGGGPSERFLYWEVVPGTTGGDIPLRSQAVRTGKWKAVRSKTDAPLELYDLAEDVGEKNNVAEQHPDVMQKIEDYLETARTVPRTYPPQEPNWGYDRLDTGYLK